MISNNHDIFILVTNSDATITLSSTDDVKLITSPDWPDPYPNNANITVVIDSPDGSTIKLTVLNLELEEPCGIDNLIIYDGKLVVIKKRKIQHTSSIGQVIRKVQTNNLFGIRRGLS